jgi:hypothetical protein
MAIVLNQSQIDAFKSILLGVQVDRATATLPQTTNAAIFNIVGGRVRVNLLIGEVTTIIQAQANATKLIGTPTTGSAVDICATADINALEVGGKLVPVGVLATALGKTNAGAAAGTTTPIILAIGTLNLSCAASSTGSIKWSVWYVPVDDGATMTAA